MFKVSDKIKSKNLKTRIKTRTRQEYPKSAFLIGKITDYDCIIGGKNIKTSPDIRGEISFRYDLQKNTTSFQLDSFNVLIGSIKTREGETGRISLCLESKKQKTRYDRKKRAFSSSFRVRVHYPLIDFKKGWKKTKTHDYESFEETFQARVKGKFAKSPKPQKDKFEIVELEVDLKKLKEIIPIIKWIKIKIIISCWWWFWFCPDGTLSRPEKRLCVQPVFIRSSPDDTSPTGTSFNTLLENANNIWRKCCIQFDAEDPIYLDNSSYKTITEDSVEEADLRAEVDSDNCIEIFVVDRWSPADAHGGGATWSGGTASAKIVTADSNLPIDQNHLAHELGHVLNLKHPGDATATRPAGCEDTVLEPSGFQNDNPSEQCESNCNNASNPLLRTTFRRCCIEPEIDE